MLQNNAQTEDSDPESAGYNPILFQANGLSGTGTVKLANFTVKGDKLYSNNHDELTSTSNGIYIGSDGLSIGNGFKVSAAGAPTIAGYTTPSFPSCNASPACRYTVRNR